MFLTEFYFDDLFLSKRIDNDFVGSQVINKGLIQFIYVGWSKTTVFLWSSAVATHFLCLSRYITNVLLSTVAVSSIFIVDHTLCDFELHF